MFKHRRNPTPSFQRTAFRFALFACSALAFVACESVPPEDAVQVWLTGWPGTQDPQKAEAIVVKGKELKCGLNDEGDLSFTPAQAANRVEFPDGAVIEAEGVTLTLIRGPENQDFARGDYVVEIKCVGSVSLFGPFGENVEGWLGENPEHGESIPLSTGKLAGPVVLRASVNLSAVMATGQAMIFGSVEGSESAAAEEGPAEEGPAEEGPAEEGASKEGTPEEGSGWGTGGGEETPEEPSGTGEGSD